MVYNQESVLSSYLQKQMPGTYMLLMKQHILWVPFSFFEIFSTLCQYLRCPAMQISCTQQLNSQMSALPSFLYCTSLLPFRRKQNFLYKKKTCSAVSLVYLVLQHPMFLQPPSCQRESMLLLDNRGMSILNSYSKHHAFCGEVKFSLLLFPAPPGQILWNSSDQPL